ncbi:MAG: DUF47 domain-containing protein [Bacteroidia bacterium]|jgi:uncharacterized protein Yka (UPF0111/DUF47 family)
MGINTIFKIFLPKDRIFYGLFEQAAENITVMGKLLEQLVFEADSDKRDAIAKQLEDYEHKNDELTHRVFQELSRNFITPFDREDIHYLATALDDVADYIWASAKKIQFHGVNPQDQGIQKMAEVIRQSATEIGNAVSQLRELKNPGKITESLVKINSMENHADDIFDMSIKNLFDKENDFKELIRRREVYTVMEVATDKCEDVANVIETIIVKYA